MDLHAEFSNLHSVIKQVGLLITQAMAFWAKIPAETLLKIFALFALEIGKFVSNLFTQNIIR
jgi:hypothetical protein